MNIFTKIIFFLCAIACLSMFTMDMTKSVSGLREMFMYPEKVIARVNLFETTGNSLEKEDFLLQMVDDFVECHNVNKIVSVEMFLYGYCYFFNSILITCNRTALFNKFPKEKQKAIGVSSTFLYDKNDIFSILAEERNNGNERKKDILNALDRFPTLNDRRFNALLQMIISHNICMRGFVLLYKDDLEGMNDFLSKIGFPDVGAQMKEAILEVANKELDIKYAISDRGKITDVIEPSAKERDTPQSLYNGRQPDDALEMNNFGTSSNSPTVLCGAYSQDKENKALRAVVKYFSDSEKYYNKLYKDGIYEWNVLEEKLPNIIDFFKNQGEEDQKKLNIFLNDIINNIIANKVSITGMLLSILVVPEGITKDLYKLIKNNPLEMKEREKLANYFCIINQQYYVGLNNKNMLSIKESPFACVYMKIPSIYIRRDVAHNDLDYRFANKRVFSVINNAAKFVKNEFTKVLTELDTVDQNLRIEFFNLYIEQFHAKHAKQFLFGYTQFFNYIIQQCMPANNWLEIVQKITKNKKLQDAIIYDPLDFYSIFYGYSADSAEKELIKENRQHFMQAIKNSNIEVLNSIRQGLLLDADVQKKLALFLVDPDELLAKQNAYDNTIFNDINTFLSIVYNSAATVKDDNVEMVIKNMYEGFAKFFPEVSPLIEYKEYTFAFKNTSSERIPSTDVKPKSPQNGETVPLSIGSSDTQVTKIRQKRKQENIGQKIHHQQNTDNITPKKPLGSSVGTTILNVIQGVATMITWPFINMAEGLTFLWTFFWSKLSS